MTKKILCLWSVKKQNNGVTVDKKARLTKGFEITDLSGKEQPVQLSGTGGAPDSAEIWSH